MLANVNACRDTPAAASLACLAKSTKALAHSSFDDSSHLTCFHARCIARFVHNPSAAFAAAHQPALAPRHLCHLGRQQRKRGEGMGVRREGWMALGLEHTYGRRAGLVMRGRRG